MTEARNRRWWVLLAFVPATLAIGLDVTVLSIASATLSTNLHASTSQAQWFFAAYTLVFGAAMVPGGMLGDRYGRKKVLLISLFIFAIGSVACALSSTPGEFIGARAFLGLGGAIATPMILGALPVLFDEEERAKAIAAIMTAAMLGYPIGPILGGWLLTHYWWGWVFLMNLPVIALAILAVVLFLPESRSENPQRFDPPGIVTLIRGSGAADLRLDRGRAERLEQLGGAGRDDRRSAHPRRLLLWRAAVRRAAPRSGSLPLARIPLGHDPRHGDVVGHVRAAVRGAHLLPGGAREEPGEQRFSHAADDRRPDSDGGGRHQAGRAGVGAR